MKTNLEGKYCLITGATSGVGRAAAGELARMGANVLGIGRDSNRCAEAKSEIQYASGNPNVTFFVADLSDMDQIHRLVVEIDSACERIDVLINNAGAFFLRRRLSKQGFEMTWALNHLNYFLLTNLLLDRITGHPHARIINVASGSHYQGTINFEDINLERGYSGWKAYSQSKLANVLFTYELDRRLSNQEVTVNALTPGFVATRIGHNNGKFIAFLVRLVQKAGGKTPEQGAETIIYLAASPEVEGVSGKYFVEKQAVESSLLSYDLEVARRLWEMSEVLTGSTPGKNLPPVYRA